LVIAVAVVDLVDYQPPRCERFLKFGESSGGQAVDDQDVINAIAGGFDVGRVKPTRG
jgi:hypothetical protein